MQQDTIAPEMTSNEQDERFILGTILVRWETIKDFLNFRMRHSQANSHIFEAMLAVYRREDEISRKELLKEIFVQGNLRSIGGEDFLDELIREVVRGYESLKIIGDQYRKRNPDGLSCGVCASEARS